MAAKKKKQAARRAAAKPKAKAAPATRALKKRKQPETLRVRNLGAGITVSDVHKSLEWYTKVLGFVAGDKWEQDGKLMGVEVRAGSASLWINQDDWAKGRDRVKGVGVRFYCTTAQDVTKLAEGIKARGGKLDHEPMKRSWGGEDFGITDPDGFKITIQTL